MRLKTPRGWGILAFALLVPCALAPPSDAAPQQATAEEVSAEVSPEGAVPRAVFPTFVQDFGEVGRGDRLRHVFTVRNEGDAPLEILSVQPT